MGRLSKEECQRLADNVRHLMDEDGISSNSELAQKAGLSSTHINRLMKNDMEAPTVPTLKRIAGVFDVHWSTLIDLTIRHVPRDKVRPYAYAKWVGADIDYSELVTHTRALADSLEESVAEAIRTSKVLYPGEDLDSKAIAEVAATLSATAGLTGKRKDDTAISVSLLSDIRSIA